LSQETIFLSKVSKVGNSEGGKSQAQETQWLRRCLLVVAERRRTAGRTNTCNNHSACKHCHWRGINLAWRVSEASRRKVPTQNFWHSQDKRKRKLSRRHTAGLMGDE